MQGPLNQHNDCGMDCLLMGLSWYSGEVKVKVKVNQNASQTQTQFERFKLLTKIPHSSARNEQRQISRWFHSLIQPETVDTQVDATELYEQLLLCIWPSRKSRVTFREDIWERHQTTPERSLCTDSHSIDVYCSGAQGALDLAQVLWKIQVSYLGLERYKQEYYICERGEHRTNLVVVRILGRRTSHTNIYSMSQVPICIPESMKPQHLCLSFIICHRGVDKGGHFVLYYGDKVNGWNLYDNHPQFQGKSQRVSQQHMLQEAQKGAVLCGYKRM